MSTWSGRSLARVVIIGVAYLLIGIVFGALANSAASHQTRVAWRLAAWLGSAIVYVAHIWYEHFELRNPPRSTALHAAAAVALGAFGLAAAAMIHSLSVAAGAHHRRLLTMALVVWPVMTGVPAFIVALIVVAALARLSRRDQTGGRTDA